VLGGAAAAWPLAARTQQRAKPARIGDLSSSSPPDVNLESFLRGMGAVGYGEGRDFVVEARYARRDYSKFPALADDLLRAQVDLIVAGGPAFRTWRLASVPVPVVFLFSGDPVDAGIVASFARPGGNVTGVSLLSLDLSVKRVQLLKEAMPAMTRVAVVSNPTHPGRRRARRRALSGWPSSISRSRAMMTSSRHLLRLRGAPATGSSRFPTRSRISTARRSSTSPCAAACLRSTAGRCTPTRAG
jgi:hypothetical protein